MRLARSSTDAVRGVDISPDGARLKRGETALPAGWKFLRTSKILSPTSSHCFLAREISAARTGLSRAKNAGGRRCATARMGTARSWPASVRHASSAPRSPPIRDVASVP